MFKTIFNKKYSTCKLMWIILSALMIISLIFQCLSLRKKTVTKEKFNTSENNDKLIFFYADWCGYCTDFKNNGLKEFMESDEVNIDIWHINADADTNVSLLDPETRNKITAEYNISSENDSEVSLLVKQMKNEYSIEGFPTIYYKSDTKTERFSTSRTCDELNTFVKNMRTSQ